MSVTVSQKSCDMRLEAANYRLNLVDPESGNVLDCGPFATERFVPPSAAHHVVDGWFTSESEWADVAPAVGERSCLYADFDGRYLHLMNDWHACSQQLSPWDFGRFDVLTWPEGDHERTEAIHWSVRVCADRKVKVQVEGGTATHLVRAGHAFGPSPLVPEEPHALFELCIAVADAHREGCDEPHGMGWLWELRCFGPTEATRSRQHASEVVVPEPAKVRGTLHAKGGLTLVAEGARLPSESVVAQVSSLRADRMSALQPQSCFDGTSPREVESGVLVLGRLRREHGAPADGERRQPRFVTLRTAARRPPKVKRNRESRGG